ncbi:hypothetical protein C1H21_19370 [Xanthomonas arboricola pv. juglandis]|nr:hypothetical protein C1H21_19370 [Xanthomonas arboricola pv. juglandis]
MLFPSIDRACLAVSKVVFVGCILLDAVESLVGRGRDALTTSGTRRESVHGGSLAASMPPRVPEPVRTSRLPSWSCADGTAKKRDDLSETT